MLNNLILKNFKCFKRETEINLKNINLFTGINGRGKSTVLQSLLLMRQSLEHNINTKQIILNGECIDIGNYEDLKNSDTSIGESIVLSYNYNSEEESFKITYFLNDSEKDKTVADISKINVIGKVGVENTTGEVGVRNVEFNLISKSKGIFFSSKEISEDLFINKSFHNLFISDSFEYLKLDLVHKNIISNISKSIFFNKIHYVSADRIGPKDFYSKASFKNFPNVGSKGQYTINLLDKMKEFIVYSNLSIQKDVPRYLFDQTQAWLSQIFKGGKLNILDTKANILTLEMNHDGSSTFYKPSNLGFGYSYVLPIIVSGLLARKGEILIIENPEAHLHSSAQARLINFLSMVSANDVQIFIETHSDHVLNALRVNAKNNIIKTSDLNILYFQSNEEEQVVPIPVLDKGKIEKWPSGFFDQMDIDFEILFND